MVRLRSHVCGDWHAGVGPTRTLVDPATEAPVAETTTEGIDFEAALTYARDVGGPALRALTFEERGGLLKEMSRALHAHREELIDLSGINNGATRGDAKFDIDGATGTLAAYARIGRHLGDARWQLDGEAEKLSSGARYVGQHVRLPRPGVAVHINAFNFPAWGTFEKIACALLAGMPVVSKPATATALVAWRMVEIIVEADILPPGALSFIAGSAGDMLDHLGPQDVVAFTGSADTAAMLRAGPGPVQRSVRFNAEADSLNAAVLAPGTAVGGGLWHSFIRNVVTDMRQKTGQKCTAVRRIIVPEDLIDEVESVLVEELSGIVVGVPTAKGVTMGPVATAGQLRDFRAGIALLSEECDVVTGGAEPIDGQEAPAGKGFYVRPTLLRVRDSATAEKVHAHEVFGPCATLVPYDGSAEAAASLVAQGQGCLVSSVYADDRSWFGDFLFAAAPWNGRIVAANEKVADQVLPPGMVLPNQVHGGPGRAGGGEELGGVRGLDFYTNRVAVQGDLGALRKILGAK